MPPSSLSATWSPRVYKIDRTQPKAPITISNLFLTIGRGTLSGPCPSMSSTAGSKTVNLWFAQALKASPQATGLVTAGCLDPKGAQAVIAAVSTKNAQVVGLAYHTLGALNSTANALVSDMKSAGVNSADIISVVAVTGQPSDEMYTVMDSMSRLTGDNPECVIGLSNFQLPTGFQKFGVGFKGEIGDAGVESR